MMLRRAPWPPAMVSQVSGTGLIAAFIVCFLAEIFRDGQLAGSLSLGVVLWVLPNCYFASKLFSRLGKVPAATLLGIFYRAEIIKLLLSGFFFVMIVKFLSVYVPALLAGYMFAQLIFFVRVIRLFKTKK